MKTTFGVGRIGVWSTPLVIGFALATGCLGLVLGSVDAVMAQGSAPSTAPTPAAVPKLEIVALDKPEHFTLTRTEASAPCFWVRNVGGGDLTATTITFEYVQDSSGTATLPDAPRVTGWTNTTLKDKGQTELCVWFPAPQKLGEFAARFLLQTSPNPESRERFADAKVTVVELAPKGISPLWATCCAAAVGLFVLMLAFFVRRKENRSFLQSPDGDYSVSRFQVMAWTIVVVSSWVYVYLHTGKQVSFPDSVMYLMGISIGSMTGAKILSTTKSQTLGGGVAAGGAAAAGGDKKSLGAVIANMLSDNGQPSTMRYQMFVWTVVAAMFFLRQVWATDALWDVPNGLLVLMGISHGGYLLDKGTAADTSMRVQSVQPSKVAHDPAANQNPATQLVIVGLNFTTDPTKITATLGGQKLTVTKADLSRLDVQLPANVLAVGRYDLVLQQPGQDAEVLKDTFEVQ